MIKKLLPTIILFVFASTQYALTNRVINSNELNKTIDQAKNEKDKLKKSRLYLSISEKFLFVNNIDSVKYYSSLAKQLANEYNYLNEEGNANLIIAKASRNNIDKNGYYTIRKDYYENINNAIEIFSKIKDKKSLASSYRYLSLYYLIYHNQNLFKENNLKALDLFKEINDSSGIAYCYLDQGRIYSILKRFEIAEHLFRVSRKVFEKGKDTLGLIELYNHLGALSKYEKNSKDQLNYLLSAAKLSDKLEDKYTKGDIYTSYGEALLSNGRVSEAIKVLFEALEATKVFKANLLLSKIYENLSNCFLATGDLDKAIKYKDSTIVLIKQNTQKIRIELSDYENFIRERTSLEQDIRQRATNIIYILIITVILLTLLTIIYLQRLRSNKLLKGKIEIINTQNEILQRNNIQLEELVLERTKDLYIKNTELEKEIAIRKETELELIKAKNDAEEGNNLKSTLLGNISHEVRTPLNGILGFVEILLDELGGSPLYEFVKKIGISSKRLLNTLNSIITVMEFTNQDYYSEKSIVEVNSFCKDVFDRFSAIAKVKELNTKFIPLEKEKAIDIDRNIIEKSLSSLLENAFKYTDKGSVTLELSRIIDKDQTKLVLKVKDTGIGIEKKKQELLFKEFKQISEGYSRKFEGLGLGLAISSKMIQFIGGEIEVKSEFGKGSEFSIILPVSEEEIEKEEIIEARAGIEKAKQENKDLQLLLVEDNDLNAEVVVLFLKKIAKVQVAKNANEALVIIDKSQFDMMLIDINLGDGMNGINLMQRMKEYDKLKNCPMIALTGYASSNHKSEFLRLGFDGYLAKPFEKEQLIKLVKEFV